MDSIQDEQACHAHICNPLLQEAQVQAGREEQYLLVLEFGGKVMPAGLRAIPTGKCMVCVIVYRASNTVQVTLRETDAAFGLFRLPINVQLESNV